jgi:hypothetical protein
MIEVLDDNGDVLDSLDPDNSCNPGGDIVLCGGCDSCLLNLAYYYGYKTREIKDDNNNCGT